MPRLYQFIMFKFFSNYLLAALLLALAACNPKIPVVKHELVPQLQGIVNYHSNTTFDSAEVQAFFASYPKLKSYETDVTFLYKKNGYHSIWYDQKGIVEFGHSLYGKVMGIENEGVYTVFPYKKEVEGIFENGNENNLSADDTELMLTSMYLYYAENVYKGINDSTVRAVEWLLPRKQVSYEALLDSAMMNTSILDRNDSILFSQYFKLRDYLLKYREIQKNGGWTHIELDPKLKAYKPGDSATAIAQIRERLYISGDITRNNGSKIYDIELENAIDRYEKRNSNNPSKKITPKLIDELNIPVDDRIKTIIVNMERCRWISPELVKAKEFIFVNIPSYYLFYMKNGKIELESAVVVGKSMSKTVIFSGNMSYIVFSPYWNVPQSIINKEIKPGIAKDPNYLEKHNMEWNNGQVRQKPGKNNSLGLVKFMFPNSNNIYLHDTPSKSYFKKESRAFSHGCIRVAEPRDLAIAILEDDPNWTPEKIDAAMHSGKELSYTLQNKIPVYIGYFTAWVTKDGKIRFYEDVYENDDRLFTILTSE
jgi:L,D-transpeptidase YcbB